MGNEYDKYKAGPYAEYLQRYLDVATAEESKINYISWDNYPFMTADGDADEQKWRETNYLFNFKILADAARDNDLELRYTLQSCGQAPYNLREVNDADLRFQIYTGMAFGVNDFTYFTYSHGDDFTDGIFNYQTGATNETLYGYAKQVNNEVHAIEDWFADYKWNTIMTKQGTDTSSSSDLSDNMIGGLELSNSDSIAHGKISSVVATQDTIAGIFEAKDSTVTTRPYGYMFVNVADPAEGKTDTVTINFADGVKGVCVCKDGKQEIVSVSGNYTFTLEAGAGAFIVPIQ